MLENAIDFTPFIVSFKLSAITTLILFCITLPLALWLAFTRSALKPIIEAISALPIVLPPTVLGFYFLVLFAQSAPLGAFLKESFNLSLLFSFEGLVVASCIYSLPFMLQPLQAGFESLDRSYIEASYTLGKSRIYTLIHVMLPLIKPSILAASIITFAHTMGEFGVVLMVGGSIPEVTKVASIAIYDHVEMLDFSTAHLYSGVLILFSFTVLLSVYTLNRKYAIKAFK